MIIGQYIHCLFYQCGTPGSNGIVSPVSIFPGPTYRVWFLAHSRSQLLTAGNANFLSTRVDRLSSTYSFFPGNWGASDSRQKGRCNLPFLPPTHTPSTHPCFAQVGVCCWHNERGRKMIPSDTGGQELTTHLGRLTIWTVFLLSILSYLYSP